MTADPWTEVVTNGAPADPHLVELLDAITSNLPRAAREHDATASAVADFNPPNEGLAWKAWLTAWARIADGRPLDGIEALSGVVRKLGVDGSDRLLHAELGRLAGMLLTMNDIAAPPAASADRAREVLLRFLRSSAKNPKAAGDQILDMVSTFESYAAQWPAHLSTAPLLSAWAVTRGVDLLTDIARARLDTRTNGLDICEDLLQDVALLCSCTATRLESVQLAKVHTAAGDCCVALDPNFARMCYASAIREAGLENRIGLQAAVNVASLSEDETKVRILSNLRNRVAGPSDAAQLWIEECAARWRLNPTASVRDISLPLSRSMSKILAIPPTSEPCMRRNSISRLDIACS